METRTKRPTLIAIVGPTASGKSGLALKIAKQFNGEIICADSRTVYKGMDIGTAKPTKAERRAVPHWGLDLVEPGEIFSAGQFKDYADAKILDIQRRGKLPILVGGTGLYVDGVLFNFSFISTKKPRWMYAWRSVSSLQKTIQRRGWQLPENFKNRRHLVRTIERAGQVGSRRRKLPEDVLLLGLMPPDEVLKEHIAKRAQKMFKAGVVGETEGLLGHYGDKAVLSMGANIYPIIDTLLRSKISKSEAIEQVQTKDWQYARRQKTWFKRNAHIKWFTSPQEAYNFLTEAL